MTGIIGFFSSQEEKRLKIRFRHFSWLEIRLFGSMSRMIVMKRLEKRGEIVARFIKLCGFCLCLTKLYKTIRNVF